MLDYEFSYAGINSYTDLGIIVGKVQKPLAPNMSESTQDVPGKYGNIYSGTSWGSQSFEIPITIPATNKEEYNLKIQNIRNCFIDTESEKHFEYPLIFGDNQGLEYYGHWTSIPTPSFINQSWDTQCTLTFTCSEPYGYGDQKELQVSSPSQKLDIRGNTKTPPVITYNLKKDVYNIGYIDPDSGEYVATGYAVDVDNTDDSGNKIDNKEPLGVNAENETLSDWSTDPTVTGVVDLDNGAIDGNMSDFANFGIAPGKTTRTDENRHRRSKQVTAVDFGDPTKHKKGGWYGPVAVRQSVPNPTSDWRICVNLHHEKRYSRAMGKVEVYLLDENRNRCGKLWIKDQEQGKVPKVGVQLGNKTHHTEMITYGGQPGYGGPKYVPGTDKKLIKNGANRKVTFYTIQNYKVAVVNKTYKDKKKVSYVNQKVKVKKTKKKKGATYTTRKVKKVGKAGSYYQSHKPKGEGDKTDKNSKHKAPANTHWESKSDYSAKTEADYNNRNVFSNFDGNFFLEKVGTRFRCWIQVMDSDEGAIGTPIAKREYRDDDHEFDFALNSIAGYCAKHNIAEDRVDSPHVYSDTLVGIGGFKYWNILDGGNQKTQKPKIIAHKGEQVIVDSEQMKVYLTDGTDLTKYTSFASTFPMLNGGQLNNWTFTPLPGDEADVTIDYRPRYK